MKRQVMTALVACLAIGSLIGLMSTAAQAQTAPTTPTTAASTCFPGASGDYPPANATIEPTLVASLADGLLVPNSSGRLLVKGGQPGLTYCGTLFSAPVAMPLTVAAANGDISFQGFTVPADFQLNAAHQLDVYRQQRLVGQFQFCVNSTGHLTALTSAGCKGASSTGGSGGSTTATKPKPAGTGSLPHTGWDHMMQVLKAAALALALGAFFMYLRRRRAAQVTQA